MNIGTCLICNHSGRLLHDAFDTTSKYSETPLAEFIERFTKYNLKEIKNNNVCSECIGEINEFDQSEIACNRIQEYLLRLFNDTLRYYEDVKIDICDHFIHIDKESDFKYEETEPITVLHKETSEIVVNIIVGNAVEGGVKSEPKIYEATKTPEEDSHIEESMQPEVEHPQESDYNSFFCPKCRKYFKQNYSLYKHLKDFCCKRSQFCCDVCSKVFHLKSRLSKHMETHNNTKYSCSKCTKSYIYKTSLISHIKYECGKDPQFVCEHCSKAFHLKSNLTKHTERHNNTSYECSECNKIYVHKCLLSKHKKYECGKESDPNTTKRFACELCPKRFNFKSYLAKHVKRHNRATYECPKCKKTYVQKVSLLKHTKYSLCARTVRRRSTRRPTLRNTSSCTTVEF